MGKDKKNKEMTNENNVAGPKKKGGKGIIILIVILLLLAAAAYVAFFVLRIGYRTIKVEKTDGKVYLTRNSKENNLSSGMNLYDGDKVKVKDESELMLLVDDDKHILAKENTKFRIKSTGSKDSGKIDIVLETGDTLIEIDNKLPDKSSFEVTTPNASLSVRGTTFNVSYDEDSEETEVFVEKGSVLVESGDEELLVEAGNGAIINDEGITARGKVNPGDTVSIGSYEQDGEEKNGAEPIEWTVLDVKDGKALIIADKVLELKVYDDRGLLYNGKHWEESQIREWLNGEFYDAAFDDDEKDVIVLSKIANGYTVWDDDSKTVKLIEEDDTKDYVFLLSTEEFEKYYPLQYETGWGYDAKYQGISFDCMCEPTEYVKNNYTNVIDVIWTISEKNGYVIEDKGEYITVEYPEDIGGKEYCTWLLRTTHDGLGLGDVCAWNAKYDGSYDKGAMKYWEYGIRPAMWVDIDELFDD